MDPLDPAFINNRPRGGFLAQKPSTNTTCPPVHPGPQVFHPLFRKLSVLGASLVITEREDVDHKVVAQPLLPSIAFSS